MELLMESLYITVFCIARWKFMRIPLKMFHRLWIDPLHENHHKVFIYKYKSHHRQSKYTFIFHMTWLILLCKLDPTNVLNSQLTCTYLSIHKICRTTDRTSRWYECARSSKTYSPKAEIPGTYFKATLTNTCVHMGNLYSYQH